jgi:hypothetical protein
LSAAGAGTGVGGGGGAGVGVGEGDGGGFDEDGGGEEGEEAAPGAVAAGEAAGVIGDCADEPHATTATTIPAASKSDASREIIPALISLSGLISKWDVPAQLQVWPAVPENRESLV